MYKMGRTWIELSGENLIWNVKQFNKILGGRSQIMAAVKANAYGHGAVEVSHILEEAGVEDFCVASLEEGIQLRQSGIKGRVLVLGYTHPKAFVELLRYDLTQTVVDAAYAEKLKQYGKKIKVHIEIDTGMHRLGERFERFEDILAMWQIDSLEITGFFSHLCVADSNAETDRDYTLWQIRNFSQVTAKLKAAGISNFKAHLLSSYGVLNYPEYCFDYARIGIALYGILSNETDTTRLKPDLRPVLTLKTRIQSVRDLKAGEGVGYGLTYTASCPRTIASLSIGYADGIPRNLSNHGWVLVNGFRAPIIGRICMDQMMVDITGIPGVLTGETAVLIGKSGKEEITAAMFACWSGTITNEVLSRLGSRPERLIRRPGTIRYMDGYLGSRKAVR